MTEDNPLQQFVIVLLMMTLAFYIQELPTSNVLQLVLPEWPYILMLYFSVSTRYFFGVVSAFIVGVIQDVFLGVPTLGLHAVIYVIASFAIIVGRLRFKHLTLSAQSLTIGFFVLLKIFITVVYSAIMYSSPSHFWQLLSIPMSILLWPGIYIFFQFFAHRHNG